MTVTCELNRVSVFVQVCPVCATAPPRRRVDGRLLKKFTELSEVLSVCVAYLRTEREKIIILTRHGRGTYTVTHASHSHLDLTDG